MSWYNAILKRIAKAAFKVEKTDEATASKRFSICQECPNFNEKELKCMICGCFMEVKTELKVHTNYFKKRNAIKKYIIDVDMVITSLAIYGYLKG